MASIGDGGKKERKITYKCMYCGSYDARDYIIGTLPIVACRHCYAAIDGSDKSRDAGIRVIREAVEAAGKEQKPQPGFKELAGMFNARSIGSRHDWTRMQLIYFVQRWKLASQMKEWWYTAFERDVVMRGQILKDTGVDTSRESGESVLQDILSSGISAEELDKSVVAGKVSLDEGLAIEAERQELLRLRVRR